MKAMGRFFKISWFTTVVMGMLLAGLAGCKGEDPYEEYAQRQRNNDDQLIQSYLTGNNITNFVKTSTGLYYVPQQPGTAVKIQAGNTATMHYVSYALQNGQKLKFESTYDSGIPKTFTAGANREIKGLEQGALLLSKDEKADLIIPSHLAFSNGMVLLYEIHVKEVK